MRVSIRAELEQHMGPLLASLKKIAAAKVPPEEVEDVVGETWLRLCRASEVDLREGIMALAHDVLRKVISDYYRGKGYRQARQTETLDRGDGLELIASGPSPEDHLQMQEACQIVRRLRRRLHGRARDIFDLLLQDRRRSDISKALQIPEGTVRWYVHRFKDMLRKEVLTRKDKRLTLCP